MKKAGLVDAMGLVDGLYPGAAAEGLRNFPDSTTVRPPRISEVYTKGTLTLARLGREAPIAAASPNGPVLRNVEGGSLDARSALPGEPPVAARAIWPVAGHRHGRTRAVPAERAARRDDPGRRGDSRQGAVGRDRRRGHRPGRASADRTRRARCWRRTVSSAARRWARRPDRTHRPPTPASTRVRRRGGRDQRRRAGTAGRQVETGESSCRPPPHSSTNARPASRAPSMRSSGSAPKPVSSRAGTACSR